MRIDAVAKVGHPAAALALRRRLVRRDAADCVVDPLASSEREDREAGDRVSANPRPLVQRFEVVERQGAGRDDRQLDGGRRVRRIGEDRTVDDSEVTVPEAVRSNAIAAGRVQKVGAQRVQVALRRLSEEWSTMPAVAVSVGALSGCPKTMD